MSDAADRVAAAVWPWREKPADAERKTAAAPARTGVLIEVSIMAAVCLLFLFVFEKVVVAAIVATVGALVLVGGLWCPPLYRGFKKFGRGLAKVVGVGLSWILLLPFFYLCFAPARLFLLLGRKDPMKRRILKDADTYWSAHRPLPGPERYHNQY